MGKIEYTRSTTMAITHTYRKNGEDSDAGQTLFFTVKADKYDSDETDASALIKKNITMSGPTNVIAVDPTDIADTVEPGKYYYDLRVKESGGNIYLVDSGTFTLVATPTNRES